MKEKAGVVFSIASENAPVAGCTLSKQVSEREGCAITHFSLAAGTDISPETYEHPKLLVVHEGDIELTGLDGVEARAAAGDAVLAPAGRPTGVATEKGAVYTEIALTAQSKLGPGIEPAKPFALRHMLPVLPDRILNADLVRDPTLKFVVMSFGAGTGLSEHAAPGDALILALEGDGVLGYEGKESPVKAGDAFKFAKNGRHWVKAPAPFKMGLLIELGA